MDDEFDFGIPGFPGTRIVIRLYTPPFSSPSLHRRDSEYSASSSDNNNRGLQHTFRHSYSATDLPSTKAVAMGNAECAPDQLLIGEEKTADYYTLPEEQNVLFVDDDAMLRKLFARSIKRVTPKWTFQEAGNGEAALVLTETQHFDIIFMDMYMASVEKRLLGTETVVEMRARGIQSRIIGLSANDKEEEFLAVGANAFIFKPIPCKTDLLRAELGRLLYADATTTTDNGNMIADTV